MAKKLPPVHPGEILREECLVPLKLTPSQDARRAFDEAVDPASWLIFAII